MSYKKFINTDLIESVLPMSILTDERNDEVEAPQDPRFKISETMNAFIHRVADVSTKHSSSEVILEPFSHSSTFFRAYVKIELAFAACCAMRCLIGM